MAKKAKAKVETAPPVTPRSIVDRCNELARQFYQAHGREVPEGYRFDGVLHPQERGMWNLAVLAFDFIEGTDVEEALDNIEEGQPDDGN